MEATNSSSRIIDWKVTGMAVDCLSYAQGDTNLLIPVPALVTTPLPPRASSKPASMDLLIQISTAQNENGSENNPVPNESDAINYMKIAIKTFRSKIQTIMKSGLLSESALKDLKRIDEGWEEIHSSYVVSPPRGKPLPLEEFIALVQSPINGSTLKNHIAEVKLLLEPQAQIKPRRSIRLQMIRSKPR